jgi:mRNA-degrading endonuclease toxin of MazEF toxin-antitoxin module
VPFPFSDQSGKKVRPVVVLSNSQFNDNSEDLLVVGITSNIIKNKQTLELTNEDLDEGKLIFKCVIKIENILKIKKTLVLKKIGKIKEEKHKLIIDKLIEILK